MEEERGSLSCAPSNRLQFPSTKEQQTIVVLGASIMCDCRLEQEIGNKTIVSELYKTGQCFPLALTRLTATLVSGYMEKREQKGNLKTVEEQLSFQG